MSMNRRGMRATMAPMAQRELLAWIDMECQPDDKGHERSDRSMRRGACPPGHAPRGDDHSVNAGPRLRRGSGWLGPSGPGSQRPRVDLRGPVRPTELVLVEPLLAPPATFLRSVADNFRGFFASAMVMSFHRVQRNHGPLGRATDEYSIVGGCLQADPWQRSPKPCRFSAAGLVRFGRQPTMMEA